MKKISVILAALLLLASCSKDLSRSNPLDPKYDGSGTGGNSYTVHGIIKDFSTNQPIQGASVTFSRSGSSPVSTTTNGSGIYSTVVPSGNYNVSSTANFFSTMSIQVSVNTDLDLPLMLTPKVIGTLTFTTETKPLSYPPWDYSDKTGTADYNLSITHYPTGGGPQGLELFSGAAANYINLKYLLGTYKGVKIEFQMSPGSAAGVSSFLTVQDDLGASLLDTGFWENAGNTSFFSFSSGDGYVWNYSGIAANQWLTVLLTVDIDTNECSVMVTGIPFNTGSKMIHASPDPARYVSKLVFTNDSAGPQYSYFDNVKIIAK
jgi:hypothetical protein